MAEPVSPEDRLREILLQKVYNGNDGQLSTDVKAELADGSINELSAYKKLVRKKGTEKLPEPVAVSGYFLQLYHRKPRGDSDERGYSAYLVNPDGIQTVHFDDSKHVPDPRTVGLHMTFGEPQTWQNLQRERSLITGATWLHAPQGTKLATTTRDTIGKSLWSFSKSISRIIDGQGLWNGYISGVFDVGEFDDDGERTGKLPIIGDGGEANLNVGITDELDPKTGRVGRAVANVKIKTQPQLEVLLGDLYDEASLQSDQALGELRDALNGTPVLVFGSGLTPKNERLSDKFRSKMKRPTVNLTGGLGVVSPYTPEQ